jgi:hypothetical protein
MNPYASTREPEVRNVVRHVCQLLFWIDILAVNQHIRAADSDAEWWDSVCRTVQVPCVCVCVRVRVRVRVCVCACARVHSSCACSIQHRVQHVTTQYDAARARGCSLHMGHAPPHGAGDRIDGAGLG